jgi:hypothetical protein
MRKLLNAELGRILPDKVADAPKIPVVVVLDNVRRSLVARVRGQKTLRQRHTSLCKLGVVEVCSRERLEPHVAAYVDQAFVADPVFDKAAGTI